MIFRPATPGLIVTLAATIILAIVSFGVPLNKSVYFLQASLTVQNVNGSIVLGTLGYCLTLSNGTTCSSPQVGYEFNPNQLLGDDLSFAQIPDTVVKWITYVLVLHIVAFGLSALSTIFGLLAHVREMSMTCCTSCISGFASSVAIAAFTFDIVLYFLVKSRVDSVTGVSGAATLGNAVWLTLAAAVALFISEFFYCFGRCCISSRPRQSNAPKNEPWTPPGGVNGYAEQMRLDAVKAEADRKARQIELGLPAFQEYEVTSPLATNAEPRYLEEESDGAYRDQAEVPARQPSSVSQQGREYSGGYIQAPQGTRAIDEYYASPQDTSGQPVRPNARQPSGYSSYSQNTVNPAYGVTAGHNQYSSTATQGGLQQYQTEYQYGHTLGGSSYHSAVPDTSYVPNNTQNYYNTQHSFSTPSAGTPYAQPQSYLLDGSQQVADGSLGQYNQGYQQTYQPGGSYYSTVSQPGSRSAAAGIQGQNTTQIAQPGTSRTQLPENYYPIADVNRVSPAGPRNAGDNRTEANRSPPGYEAAFAQSLNP